MILGFGHGLGFGGRAPAWTPSALGASLLGWWDAEDASTITTSGSAVSSWRDKVGGYDVTQAFGSSRPTYSATSFNSRPGITFDGVDDCLEMASVGAFPTGSTASEIWALVDNQSLGSDVTSRRIAAYGGTATAAARAIARGSTASTNRASAVSGDGTTAVFPINTAADFAGRHVIRGIFSPTSAQADLDGTANGALATSTNTSTTRTRIASATGAGPSNFFQGVASAILITAALSADQAAQLYTYLNARKGS